MPRFVIQHHITKDQPHWDLLIEQRNDLATWRVLLDPKDWPGKTIPCQKTADHRRIYLTYEGPISNDRGDVQIFASGACRIRQVSEDLKHVALYGDNISGQMDLQHLHDDEWQLCFQGEVTP